MFLKNKILLCAAIALSIILGNVVHSFVKFETHYSLSTNMQTTEMNDKKHSHSHSHHEESEETSSLSKHVHSHNSIDHTHDLPVILTKPSFSLAKQIISPLQSSNDLAVSYNVHGLDRPPRGPFLVALS
ncbi:hypothetical protein [Terasakiella sp. SH-1]|uniref:hypothetical protein n=1 Tax=Terasakiella sp. SH-1 TaxID=2560057 RepID=UPI0010741923|nr:hypothetical protein [Terasakiella sp. SH-1]